MGYVFFISKFRFYSYRVSLSEMRGLPLILVCGLLQVVTLSDMLVVMEGELLFVPYSQAVLRDRVKILFQEFLSRLCITVSYYDDSKRC